MEISRVLPSELLVMNVQRSPAMRTWVTGVTSGVCWPLARRVKRLVIRQLPWKRVRLISSARARRSCLGSGAGANASVPIRANRTRQRRTFIARLRSLLALQGDDEVPLGRRVEAGRPQALVAPVVDDLHLAALPADEA